MLLRLSLLCGLLVSIAVATPQASSGATRWCSKCPAGVVLPDLASLVQEERGDLRETWKSAGASFLPLGNNYFGEDGKVQEFSTFERPLPHLLDPDFLEQYDYNLNLEQKFQTTCKDGQACNLFTLEGGPFIAVLNKAFIEDESVFNNKTIYLARRESGINNYPFTIPQPGLIKEVRCYKKLITVLQPYGDNYYHFVEETLPRIILAREAMKRDPELLLVTRTKIPFMMKFFDRLGIPKDRIVGVTTPPRTVAFYAEEVYVPRPIPVFLPDKESLYAVKKAIEEAGQMTPSKENLIVYITRNKAWSRDVTNEELLLKSIRQYLNELNKGKDAKDKFSLVVFYSNISLDETVALFHNAKVIMGPHGAGFANMLWATPSATVLEFIHTYDPLMIYWHTARVFAMDYWMLPVPDSSWARQYTIPIPEVIEILHRILQPSTPAITSADQPIATRVSREISSAQCQPGSVYNPTTDSCEGCPAGTYYSSVTSSCVDCPAGRYNPLPGSLYCTTCPADTYSNGEGASECVACSPGHTTKRFIGVSDSSSCIASSSDDPSSDATPTMADYIYGDRITQQYTYQGGYNNRHYTYNNRHYNHHHGHYSHYSYYYHDLDDDTDNSSGEEHHNHDDDNDIGDNNNNNNHNNNNNGDSKLQPQLLPFAQRVSGEVSSESPVQYYTLRFDNNKRQTPKPIIFLELAKHENCGGEVLTVYVATEGIPSETNTVDSQRLVRRRSSTNQEVLFHISESDLIRELMIGVHIPVDAYQPCTYEIIAHNEAYPTKLETLHNELNSPNGWKFYNFINDEQKDATDFDLEIVPDYALCRLPPRIYLAPAASVDNVVASLATPLHHSYEGDSQNAIKIPSLPAGEYFLSVGSDNPWPCSFNVLVTLGGKNIGENKDPEDEEDEEEDPTNGDPDEVDDPDKPSTPNKPGDGDSTTDPAQNTDDSNSPSEATRLVKWIATGIISGLIAFGMFIMVVAFFVWHRVTASRGVGSGRSYRHRIDNSNNNNNSDLSAPLLHSPHDV